MVNKNNCFTNCLRPWLLMLALLFGTAVSKADEPAIQLTLPDGSLQFFVLEELPIARFEDQVLIVSSTSHEVSIDMIEGSVVNVVYINTNDTGLDDPRVEISPIFRVTSTGLEARNLQPGSVLYVYNIGGSMVSQATADRSGFVSVSIADTGVFIVKTSVSSFKIKK